MNNPTESTNLLREHFIRDVKMTPEEYEQCKEDTLSENIITWEQAIEILDKLIIHKEYVCETRQKLALDRIKCG